MLRYYMTVRAGGFTLIEVVLVVAMLAILAATVILKNPIEKIKVDSAARKLVADVRYARKLAVTTQQRSGVTFNANGYSLFLDVAGAVFANSPGGSCSTDAAGKFVVDYTLARCSELSGITLGFTNATVAFDPLGSPVDAGGTPLGVQTVTVSGAGGTRQITIEALTGRVSD